MINGLTQFADSSSGIGALGIDGKALIIQVITFLLAFWVLQHWAFKPIIKVMERRRETIEKGVKLGEQMQKEKVELEAKVAKALHEARAKADEIVAAAHDQGRQTVAAAENNAREKAEGLIASAEDRIKQEATRARKQVEKELIGLVSDATEAIIDEKVDAQKDAALIDRAMKEHAKA
ncbi:MAG TPA: F0F1 ATP synthase subunit B [Candidatus Saccharimonadales bacterium]|jgi:F-type H+-transporting ATPase subunit b